MAAETAELVFTVSQTSTIGQAFCADMRQRMGRVGRDRAYSLEVRKGLTWRQVA